MAESITSRVQSHLLRLLARKESLAKFEAWFVGQSWDVDRIGSYAEMELVHEIELALAELSSSHWTEQEFRDLMRQLTRTVVVDLSAPSFRTSSASVVKMAAIPFRFVDRGSAMASA